MPTGIVTETCPAPECNSGEKDSEQFLDEMMDYIEMFEPAFQRIEQLERTKVNLRGLLGDVERKHVEHCIDHLPNPFAFFRRSTEACL